MNEDAANTKVIRLIDYRANIWNSWISVSNRQAIINYFLNKIDTES